MKKILVICFILSNFVFLLASDVNNEDDYNTLTQFISVLNENELVDMDITVTFHVAQQEGIDEIIDVVLNFNFKKDNKGNWFIEFSQPDLFEGIGFVYLSNENILFSVVEGNPWKQYRLVNQFTLIAKILADFFEGLLDERNYKWAVVDNKNHVVYQIVPDETRMRFLSLIGGGGYVPNMININLLFNKKDGFLRLPDSLKISERFKKEWVLFEFERINFEQKTNFFNQYKEIYYKTFE
ncbi:MAG: hypothetical protein FXF54_00765 [Kosmotoga sp.]|nr:MAG: hypothetical protein FXF54_00765 [Kosmotoga sp.]